MLVEFRYEKVCKAKKDYIGQFIEADSRNFNGLLRNYVRIWVYIDIRALLKQNMKIQKADEEWMTASFQFECLHTFCFYCGILGHSDQVCEKLYDSSLPRSEFRYDISLRANPRRASGVDSSKWIRQGGKFMRKDGVEKLDDHMVVDPIRVAKGDK